MSIIGSIKDLFKGKEEVIENINEATILEDSKDNLNCTSCEQTEYEKAEQELRDSLKLTEETKAMLIAYNLAKSKKITCIGNANNVHESIFLLAEGICAILNDAKEKEKQAASEALEAEQAKAEAVPLEVEQKAETVEQA